MSELGSNFNAADASSAPVCSQISSVSADSQPSQVKSLNGTPSVSSAQEDCSEPAAANAGEGNEQEDEDADRGGDLHAKKQRAVVTPLRLPSISHSTLLSAGAGGSTISTEVVQPLGKSSSSFRAPVMQRPKDINITTSTTNCNDSCDGDGGIRSGDGDSDGGVDKAKEWSKNKKPFKSGTAATSTSAPATTTTTITSSSSSASNSKAAARKSSTANANANAKANARAKDPNAPKGAKSSYIFFAADLRKRECGCEWWCGGVLCSKSHHCIFLLIAFILFHLRGRAFTRVYIL